MAYFTFNYKLLQYPLSCHYENIKLNSNKKYIFIFNNAINSFNLLNNNHKKMRLITKHIIMEYTINFTFRRFFGDIFLKSSLNPIVKIIQKILKLIFLSLSPE